MKTTNSNINAGLKALIASKAAAGSANLSSRMVAAAKEYGIQTDDSACRTFTAEELIGCGFTADESAALVFVLSQDGATDFDNADRWLYIHRFEIARLAA